MDCPGCGKPFTVPDATNADGTAPSRLRNDSPDDEGTLDEANRFLERLIGNVIHAILGVFRRVSTVFHWFWSAKFAKFVVLIVVLAALLAALGGIAIAPYAVILFFFEKHPVEVPDGTPFWDESRWQWFLHPAGSWVNVAIFVEILWLALFVFWGVWIGIKSYKRGALARWRERRRARKALRS